jgi:hypothetical protein
MFLILSYASVILGNLRENGQTKDVDVPGKYFLFGLNLLEAVPQAPVAHPVTHENLGPFG